MDTDRTVLPSPGPRTARGDAVPGYDAHAEELAHALQVDGRAPFRRIAEVLGVSDQTVARRYTRLRTAGLVRVRGLTDPLRVGELPWMVRVRCTPDAVASLGDALTRRPDTSWVGLMSGGTEITSFVRAPEPGRAETPLLQKLPRTPRVLEVTAYGLLHVFFGREASTLTKSGPLSAEQVRALTPADAPDPSARNDDAPPIRLDEADRRLAAVLAEDGRAQLTELAAATGWSQSTVRRRMSELRAAGALYYDTDLDQRILDRRLRVTLWLDVAPDQLAATGAALAEHPEVAFAAATTGPFNVFITATCASPPAFYRYLTDRVSTLPGIRRTDTAMVHRMLKGPGPLLPATR